MSSVAYIARPIVTARDAIASHVRWKITLLMAVRMKETLSERATRSIEHPCECAIRQWLTSAHTLAIRLSPEYHAVLHQHARFHHQMHTIARLIHDGQFAFAEHLLHHSAAFHEASSALANALMALERSAEQATQTLLRSAAPRSATALEPPAIAR